MSAPLGLSFACYDNPGMFPPARPEDDDEAGEGKYLVGLTLPRMRLQVG